MTVTQGKRQKSFMNIKRASRFTQLAGLISQSSTIWLPVGVCEGSRVSDMDQVCIITLEKSNKCAEDQVSRLIRSLEPGVRIPTSNIHIRPMN